MTHPVLLVGVGGSGLDTLAAFNRSLASNPAMRHRMADDIYYLAVDTEMCKLDSFRQSVRRDMEIVGARQPSIEPIYLSRDIKILNEIISPYFSRPFSGKPDDPGLARLREHWWFDPNGSPFSAPDVTDLECGSGMCPQAAYGLAWYHLDNIGDAVKRIVTRVIMAHGHGTKPLERMDIFVVASLAGGTGRGAWGPIAFKIREVLLENYNLTTRPVGIFFDAEVFESVCHGSPGQGAAIYVNSATGISELACLMRNDFMSGDEQSDFRLPNMASPDRFETDVLKIDRELNHNSGTPVDEAFLICGRNGYAYLPAPRQYAEMAGEALYAMVVGDEYRAPYYINNPSRFKSFAAVSCEVNKIEIWAYLESILRKLVAKKVCESTLENPALLVEARKLVGAGSDSDAPDSFFATTHFYVGELRSALFSAPEGYGDATLVQRLIATVRADKAGIVDNFREELERQDPENAWRKVRTWLCCDDLDDARTAEILDKVLGQSFRDSPRQAVIDAALRAFAPEKEKALAPSIGRALAAIDLMVKELQASVDNLGKAIEIDIDGRSYATPEDVEAGFKKIFDEKARRSFWIIKPFTPRKIEALCGIFDCYLGLAIFFKFRQALRAVFETAIHVLHKVEWGFQTLSRVSFDVCHDYDKDEDGDCYHNLFAEPGNEAVLAAIPTVHECVTDYRRVIKPIMSKEDVVKLVLRKDSHIQDDPIIADEVASQLIKLLDGEMAPNEDDKLALRCWFRHMLESSVSVDANFMDDKFTLESVLRNNLAHWNKLLSSKAGNRAEFEGIADRFRAYLGVKELELEMVYVDNRSQISFEDLFRDLVVSMVGTCKPWVLLREWPGDEQFRTLALLPIELDSDTGDLLKRAAGDAHSGHVELVHYGMESCGEFFLSRDRIVVLTEQDIRPGMCGASALDSVASLDYWKKPDVLARLGKAELQDGESIFAPKGMYHAYGYISPRFVRDPAVSAKRWKPWTEELEYAPSEENKVTPPRETQESFPDVFISYRRDTGLE
jgi:hypothetical protein